MVLMARKEVEAGMVDKEVLAPAEMAVPEGLVLMAALVVMAGMFMPAVWLDKILERLLMFMNTVVLLLQLLVPREMAVTAAMVVMVDLLVEEALEPMVTAEHLEMEEMAVMLMSADFMDIKTQPQELPQMLIQ